MDDPKRDHDIEPLEVSVAKIRFACQQYPERFEQHVRDVHHQLQLRMQRIKKPPKAPDYNIN